MPAVPVGQAAVVVGAVAAEGAAQAVAVAGLKASESMQVNTSTVDSF